MSNYTKTTNFASKDNLSPGNPLKIVKGTEIDTEFNNIATAVATKTDGAASSTDNAIARFDSTTGKIIQNSAVTIDDTTGDIVGTATQGVFNTVSTTVNAFGAATAVNIGAATGTATVNNTTLAAKAITASTTLAVTGTSTLTGAVTATAGVTGPITSSSVTITGGSISGITDLAVADGGTGASTAAGGLNNLLPSQTGNANKYLQTDGTNATWDAVTLSTADITGTLPVANGGTGVTSSTGTGNVVLSNSPTLVTPALGTPASGTLTNATGLPISTGVSGLGSGVATFLGTPSSANLASAVTDETGSGALVFANSPTLVTPTLGTPASATLTNATGLPISTGVSGLGTGVATFLATPSSANLISAVTDETGTGSLVFATSPTLVTPALGTPSALVGTNITGTASGLTAGNVTTNANLTGAVTSVGNATSLGSFSSANLLGALTDETGTGSAVFSTSPTLVTPILGTPTSATLTNATGLPLTTGVTGQLPVANGGTGTATPSIVAGTNVTVTGTWPNQTIAASSGGTPGGSTTQVQYNNAGAFGGITGATTNGTALTLVAPVLGTPASATLTNATGLPISTGVSGLGTGVATALAVNVGSAGAPVVNGGALGTPSGGTVTNLTGTASININGTVGATTPTTVVATTVKASTTMGVGAATPSGSGSGITFPATQSASSDANTLDDYEEGTWTPELIVTFGGSGLTTTVAGAYRKVGSLVFISGQVTVTAIGSGYSGAVRIDSLPFTTGANLSGVTIVMEDLTGFSTGHSGRTQNGFTRLWPNYTTSTGYNDLAYSNLTSTTKISFTLTLVV